MLVLMRIQRANLSLKTFQIQYQTVHTLQSDSNLFERIPRNLGIYTLTLY